ncbi:MAG: hypothetical protein AABX82_04990 [Nanoarchaeota archaeon]|mgnify:CR=1 FL=1
MKEKIAFLIVIFIMVLGFFGDEGITGNAIYTAKADLSVTEISAHGVDKATNDMHVVFGIENLGDSALKEGTEISARFFVRYTSPPVKHGGSAGSISTAEVFLEEAKATYVLTEDLKPGESVLAVSPPVPILLSTVRFFEKYDIKNRITVELDYERAIAEEDEKNNKLVKWYYMKEWSAVEEELLEPESLNIVKK